jgi:maltose phosphorylase
MQASTAVMYGIWNYVTMTGDTAFLYEKGIEMLVEICRMLASRGDFSPVTKQYGYYGVMGPDEFQMMVNNNAYTNFMAKKTFEYTLQVLEQMAVEDAENQTHHLEAVKAKLFLTPEEPQDWRHKAEVMALPYSEDSKLFEQHDGYFSLPVVKLDEIPVEEFPLYSHWSYERIYRNSMLKQPDVLMFMLLFNSDFSKDVLEANFDFYEPRCIHESSLSPSVHAILASQLGKSDLAYQFFGFATRMDLDNYNRNTKEGLHTTSISGSWMNIVYGFGGLRSDTSQLSLSPTIPAVWNSYSFKLQVKGVVIEIAVNRESVTISCEQGACTLKLYDEVIAVGHDKVRRPLRG